MPSQANDFYPHGLVGIWGSEYGVRRSSYLFSRLRSVILFRAARNLDKISIFLENFRLEKELVEIEFEVDPRGTEIRVHGDGRGPRIQH